MVRTADVALDEFSDTRFTLTYCCQLPKTGGSRDARAVNSGRNRPS